jgi:hypothetical protein
MTPALAADPAAGYSPPVRRRIRDRSAIGVAHRYGGVCDSAGSRLRDLLAVALLSAWLFTLEEG